jgi:hypothetical protein
MRFRQSIVPVSAQPQERQATGPNSRDSPAAVGHGGLCSTDGLSEFQKPEVSERETVAAGCEPRKRLRSRDGKQLQLWTA